MGKNIITYDYSIVNKNYPDTVIKYPFRRTESLLVPELNNKKLENYAINKKDPAVAFLLSLSITGLGQMYIGDGDLGVVLLVAEAASIVGIYKSTSNYIIKMAKYNNIMQNGTWVQQTFDAKKPSQLPMIIFISLSVGIHLTSIIHAPIKCNKYNSDLLSIKFNGSSISLCYNF